MGRSSAAPLRATSALGRGSDGGWCGEGLGEPEGEGRGAVLPEVLDALATFGDGRDVADGNPPEAVASFPEIFEPFGALAEDFEMMGAVSEIAKRLERVPYGHIQE